MRTLVLAIVSLIMLSACATTPDPAETEYRVSHIQCATEADAVRAIARLHAGESFEAVAADMSTDLPTRANGGKIKRWTRGTAWSGSFGEEVARLRVGEISGRPIRTEYGWHVVRVDAVRPAAPGCQ